MISLDEARARILDGLAPTGAELVPVAEAWGRVLAAPVVSRLTHPAQDVSAMDGYALRSADGPRGATLPLAGISAAGHPFEAELPPGSAVRIFTGAFVPPGADCVVLQENTAAASDRVTFNEPARTGLHIRRAGQDFSAGDTVLAPGRRLGARDLGLAAAANHPWLSVHRRPRVAILATGDEIALPGDPVPPGGLVSSNSLALAAIVRAWGGDPVLLPLAADDATAIAASATALAAADLAVTTGGASVGEHDLVRAGLSAAGLQLDFWKVAMRPGKPLIHGRLLGTKLLGLPGNPVSAVICALRFVVPALARLAGLPDSPLPTERAVLGADLPANDGRADHLRATVEETVQGPVVTAFPRQDSARSLDLARADALILRAPHAPLCSAGETVEMVRLARLGV